MPQVADSTWPLRASRQPYNPPVACTPKPAAVSSDNGNSRVSSKALAGRSSAG